MTDPSQFTWRHYSRKPITKCVDADFSAETAQNLNPIKPAGIYFAVDDKWLEWCTDHDFVSGNPRDYTLYTLSNVSDLKLAHADDRKCIDAYILHNEYSKFMPQYDWAAMQADGYDGLYVNESLAAGGFFMSDTWQWHAYDVATVVVWNAGKCKLV